MPAPHLMRRWAPENMAPCQWGGDQRSGGVSIVGAARGPPRAVIGRCPTVVALGGAETFPPGLTRELKWIQSVRGQDRTPARTQPMTPPDIPIRGAAIAMTDDLETLPTGRPSAPGRSVGKQPSGEPSRRQSSEQARVRRSTTTQARHGESVYQLYESLRTLVINGTLPPGGTRSQVSLAKMLKVSRTPLREALRMLESEGLVERPANKVFRVTDINPEEIEALYSIRLSLEGLAISITVPTLGPPELSTLYELIAQLQDATHRYDRDTWLRPHNKLHSMLVAGAGPTLTTQLESYGRRSDRYRLLLLAQNPEVFKRAHEDHVRIVEHCRVGNALAARREIALHLFRTAVTILNAMSPGYNAATLHEALSLALGGAELGVEMEQKWTSRSLSDDEIVGEARDPE